MNGACNNSFIGGNAFQRHFTGLLYETGAVSGVQSPTGNRWLGNWSGTMRGAVNWNTQQQANQSRYDVSSQNAPLMPPNSTPIGWFAYIPGQISYTCGGSCPPQGPSLAISVNNTDLAIINNQIPQNQEALPWMMRRGLYEKLDKNPGWQNSPPFAPFYQQHQAQPIGRVVQSADALAASLIIDTADVTEAHMRRQAVEDQIQALLNLDSAYANNQIGQGAWEVAREQQSIVLQQIIDDQNNCIRR